MSLFLSRTVKRVLTVCRRTLGYSPWESLITVNNVRICHLRTECPTVKRVGDTPAQGPWAGLSDINVNNRHMSREEESALHDQHSLTHPGCGPRKLPLRKERGLFAQSSLLLLRKLGGLFAQSSPPFSQRSVTPRIHPVHTPYTLRTHPGNREAYLPTNSETGVEGRHEAHSALPTMGERYPPWYIRLPTYQPWCIPWCVACSLPTMVYTRVSKRSPYPPCCIPGCERGLSSLPEQ